MPLARDRPYQCTRRLGWQRLWSGCSNPVASYWLSQIGRLRRMLPPISVGITSTIFYPPARNALAGLRNQRESAPLRIRMACLHELREKKRNRCVADSVFSPTDVHL